MEYLVALRTPQLAPDTAPSVISPPGWTPPPPNYVKVNSDTAWLAPNSTGLGVIIQDVSGSLLGGSTIPVNCSSVTIAEANALLTGVNLAITVSLKNVIFELDSKDLIS
ncbi:uncharacterized protein LOC112194668 [Rosa chinensis]|uniref:uncharacterized protein LOC112194668 n=1 Tax=Rosa chinensis TaxID=74649 RepID=UPI000D0902C8|nr:uncharacterized protein LOC112194668 [Rosa chinensis]